MTSTGKPVVVGIDGSDVSNAALDWAIGSARAHHEGIVLVHAWSVPIPPSPVSGAVPPTDATPFEDAAHRLAEAAAQRVRHAGIDVTTRVVAGPPAHTLLAEADNAALVVLGSRGLGGFSEMLLGSTSVQVATHAPCPVVVIRPHAPVPGGDEAGRIVVGVEGPGSADVLEFAFSEASFRGVGLTAVHAWNAPSLDAPGVGAPINLASDEVADEELRLLAESLGGFRERYPDVDVRQHVIHGSPAPALVTASAGALLLVVGTRGRGGFRALLLGSTSHAVLHHAYCPVAVVRTNK